MKKTIVLTIGVALASLLALASGCRSVGYEPIPAPPIAVQPVVGAPVQPVVPIPETSGPVATSVAGVEVRSAPVAETPEPKTKALLIVQNHTGEEGAPQALSTLGDWLQTALGARTFSVVNPHDVIGVKQNTGTWGEGMPESSATQLADLMEIPVLLTASVTSARVREIGGSDSGWQAVLEFTLTAKTVPGGEGIVSVNTVARSKKERSLLAFEQKTENTWAEVCKEGAYKAASKLCKDFETSKWEYKKPETVRVAFSANVEGANVRIDGVSCGTVAGGPKVIAVTKGLHNLEISYPGLVGFKDLVKIQEETTFEVQLALTSAGEAARKKDALFDATMKRMEKSGATDDLVRELMAKGYERYLTTSHVQLEGMPQSLVMPQFTPSSELNVPGGPSTEQLIDRAGKLAE